MKKTILEPLQGNALTTLCSVMEFIGMEPDDETIPRSVKNNLTRLTNAASAYIETMTSRKLGIAKYVEAHHASGSQELCLNQYPIVSVSSVKDVESRNEFAPESYSFSDTGHIGVLYRDVGWGVRGYRSGLANDYTVYNRYLQVTYTAGYILPQNATKSTPATLPYDLQFIVWQMVQQQWNLALNGANGLSGFSISDVSWTFDKELSTLVQDVISRYRRWV